MKDVQIEVSDITKETKYINPITGAETSRKRRRGKLYEYLGTDWLFAEHRIYELDDEKIDRWIEYHDAMCSHMKNVREDRRIERLAKLNQVKINLSPLSSAPSGARARTKVNKVISHKFVSDPNAVRINMQTALTAVLGRVPSQQEVDAAMKAAGY